MRLPQHLVGEEITDAGNDVLVEQPRLERRVACTDALVKIRSVDLECVGPETVDVRIEHDSGEPALVEEQQIPTVVEVEPEACPGRVELIHVVEPWITTDVAVDDDTTAHPEVEAEAWRISRELKPH